MIEHIKKWNGWRKNNLNSKFYKILVLFNIVHSPTFGCYGWATHVKRNA